MCGIAGWYRRGGRQVPDGAIARACEAIVHRGPDDSGMFADGDFAFGMRRLSIIDLAGGHQPIFSPDRRYAITFNGEIYNHPDLRPELEAWGWNFATHSDTETLLAAFVRWGDDACKGQSQNNRDCASHGGSLHRAEGPTPAACVARCVGD